MCIICLQPQEGQYISDWNTIYRYNAEIWNMKLIAVTVRTAQVLNEYEENT